MTVLFLTALACSVFPSPAATPTTVVVKTPQVARVVTATRRPKATPTEKPAPTEAAATKGPTGDSTIGPQTAPTESWRIPPMKDAILLASDQTPDLDPNMVSTMDKQARNLAIPKPYYFEIYELPEGIKYTDVRDYYDGLITQNGMKKALDNTYDNGVSDASWIGTMVHNRKYLVQYFAINATNHTPLMFIIYSNPQ